MGWGFRLVAGFVMLVFLLLGAWPISLIILVYLVLSRKPRVQRVYVQKEGAFARSGRPWGRYAIGTFLLLLALVAFESGGTFSPVFFFACGTVALAWPFIR